MNTLQDTAPVISVIVPVYRCAKTLNACVESVLNQDFSAWELILVDDGSPDESGRLCDEWAKKDSRIQVLHQENGGASAARNAGLDTAQGTYLDFLDSDDSLLPGLFSSAVSAMENEHLDLFLFCLRRLSDGGFYRPEMTGLFSTPAELRPQLEHLMIGSGLFDSPCNKLFRRSVIGELRFDPALKVNEDVLFNLQYLPRCGAVLLTDTCFYLQNDTEIGSLSRQMRTDYLDAESATRPAFSACLSAIGCSETEQNVLVDKRRAVACRNQFGILTGRMGHVDSAVQKKLFSDVFSFEPARQMLLQQLSDDPNRIQAILISFCVRHRFAGLLSALCQLKNRILT